MKRLLVALFILALVLTACGTTRTEGPKEYDYRTGTEGLVIEFPNGLPNQLYENDRNVRFSAEVKNKGAFPQPNELNEFEGYLWIGGYDQDIVDIRPINWVQLSEVELEGKNQYNERGGSSFVEFSSDIYDLPSGTSYYKPTMIFTATYFYKTIASPVICLDPEPRSTRIRDKVCTVQDTSLSDQGAPIAVTNIEQDVTSDTVLFKIEVQNLGNGMVIPEGKVDDDPNQGYDWRDMNEVKIEGIRAGDLRMSSCRPDIGDRVELIENKGYIFCRLDKSLLGGRVYTTPLNIELEYGYSTSQSRQIEIFEEIEY